jgi:EAL domain-containing protein (putative c-di-GMP-specific phosphodiesterase class I)
MPDFMKIKMTLIRDVDSQPYRQKLIRLLNNFAQTAGAKLIGMGVESQAEVDTLKECGVELFQGFHFGRPGFKPVH